MNLHSISHNVARLKAAIAEAEAEAGRSPGSVRLIAVSKTHPAAAVAAAREAGLSDFGENYLQDAAPKIRTLDGLPITWHFIGAVQSNKTRAISELFHWVHTVDREKIGRRLNDHCPADRTLNVCLQVNIDGDPAKAGVDAAEAGELMQRLLDLPRLRVRGLMTILHRDADPLASYRRLADLFERLGGAATADWDTLSMGMSNDFRAAIMAGATHVRIGTAIFGPRRQATGGSQE